MVKNQILNEDDQECILWFSIFANKRVIAFDSDRKTLAIGVMKKCDVATGEIIIDEKTFNISQIHEMVSKEGATIEDINTQMSKYKKRELTKRQIMKNRTFEKEKKQEADRKKRVAEKERSEEKAKDEEYKKYKEKEIRGPW